MGIVFKHVNSSDREKFEPTQSLPIIIIIVIKCSSIEKLWLMLYWSVNWIFLIIQVSSFFRVLILNWFVFPNRQLDQHVDISLSDR